MGSSPKRVSSSSSLNKLPLRVFNTQGVKSVSWFFDGEPVSVGEDGYVGYSHSGELKVYVDYSDGSRDVMVKKVKAL